MKRSILLIEDNLEMQSLLRTLLEEEGYHVVSATNGCDAINVLHTQSQLQLILLDLSLPDMKTDQLLFKIEEDQLAQDVPIVFFSATPNLNKMKLPKRVSGSIQKPFQIEHFLKKIQCFRFQCHKTCTVNQ